MLYCTLYFARLAICTVVLAKRKPPSIRPRLSAPTRPPHPSAAPPPNSTYTYTRVFSLFQ